MKDRVIDFGVSSAADNVDFPSVAVFRWEYSKREEGKAGLQTQV